MGTPLQVCSRNGVRHTNEICANLSYAVKRFVCILNCYIFKYDVLSEYLTLFWFVVFLNECEICLEKFKICAMFTLVLTLLYFGANKISNAGGKL